MSAPLTNTALASGLMAEFASAIEAVVGGPVTTASGPVPPGLGWAASLTASGEHEGTFTVWVDKDGAAAVTRLVLGIEGEVEPAAVSDMLREMWAQAASALCLKPEFPGLALAVDEPSAATTGAAFGGFVVALGDRASMGLAMAGDFMAPRAAAGGLTRNLEVVLDIDLPLIVRFGHTVMSLKALTALGPGSIVDMGRSPDDPVELMVSDRVIARGEVVIVAGNYGVRITDLVSPGERVRALEG